MNGRRAPDSVVPKSRYLFAAALAALALGVLEASGIVELPFGAWFSSLAGSVLSSTTLNDFMTSYGYASVFALMVLESASLPIPSEVVLPLAGYFVWTGAMNFWTVIAVSTIASLVGALVDYYLAVWLGRPFVVALLRLFRLHRNALDRAEAWFARSAQWTVLVARFVPGLRTVISLPAGLFEMNLGRFIVMTVVGCFAWSVVLVYAGLAAGQGQVGNAFASSPAVVDGLSALVALVSLVYVAYYVYFALRGPRVKVSPPSSVS